MRTAPPAMACGWPGSGCVPSRCPKMTVAVPAVRAADAIKIQKKGVAQRARRGRLLVARPVVRAAIRLDAATPLTRAGSEAAGVGGCGREVSARPLSCAGEARRVPRKARGSAGAATSRSAGPWRGLRPRTIWNARTTSPNAPPRPLDHAAHGIHRVPGARRGCGLCRT